MKVKRVLLPVAVVLIIVLSGVTAFAQGPTPTPNPPSLVTPKALATPPRLDITPIRPFGDIADWSIAGNDGIDGSNDFLGTLNEQPLVFRVANKERMRIGTNGKTQIDTVTITFQSSGKTNPMLGFRYSDQQPDMNVWMINSRLGGILFNRPTGIVAETSPILITNGPIQAGKGGYLFPDGTLQTTAQLKGDKGDKGEKGDTGAQGIQGLKGETGDRGSQGAQGVQGPKGDKGDRGDKGDKGDRAYGTVAICVSAYLQNGTAQSGICSCTGRVISNVSSANYVSATSDTGSCEAYGGIDSYGIAGKGCAMVCAP